MIPIGSVSLSFIQVCQQSQYDVSGKKRGVALYKLMGTALLLAVSFQATASIDVRSFGAKGDGITDDTVAIQRAADALNGSRIGREALCLTGCQMKYVDGPYPAVIFPSGTYRVTGPVVFTGNVKLLGEGGAKIINSATECDTFYVRDSHRLVVENMVFEGGAVHLRHWTRNRDVSYLKVSGCTFKNASDTAIVAISSKWYKGEKKKGNPAEENVEVVRAADGRCALVSRGPITDFTAYNNSTLILIENSLFKNNATSFWGYSDGTTIRHCGFIAPKAAKMPQLRVGNGGFLGVEMYLRDLRFRYIGSMPPDAAAIVFEGGRVELTDSIFEAETDLIAVRSTSRLNEYTTASSLSLRNITVNTGAAPVVSLKGPSFPNRLYASGVKTLQEGVRGKRLYSFDVEPDEDFVKGIPIRDPADNYKHLTCVPAENCCVIVREGVDENVFDVSLPPAIRFLETKGPGALRRDFGVRNGAEFGKLSVTRPMFADETIGRALRNHPGDDTAKVAALIASAKLAGGGVVELPDRWVTLSRTLELPDNVLLTAKGCAAIEQKDRDAPAFIIPEGANVALKGIFFSGGGSAVVTTASKGSLTLVDCGFTDFKGPAIRAESAVPCGFHIALTGGNSYTANLYCGNADVVVDAYWFECAPSARTDFETPRSHAAIVNTEGGALRLRDFLGVPVYFGHLAKSYMKDPAFEREWKGDYRWIDNRGTIHCKNVRFGGEYHGITAIYAYGKSDTYVEGGVNETASEVALPGRNCIVACDSEDCKVTVVDVLAHTYKMAQLAKVKDGDTYRRHPMAAYSNNFPFRLTNDWWESAASTSKISTQMSKATLIAHRGHLALDKKACQTPQNTLAAFREAVDYGIGFECDVVMTKDGCVFTNHEPTFEYIFGIREKAIEVTWEGLVSKLIPRDYTGTQHPETRMALFEEVCELARNGRWIYVEVKSGPEIVPVLKKILAGQSKANAGNLLFISFNKDVIRALKKELPQYKALLLLYSRHAWPSQKDMPDHSPYTVDQCLAELKDCGADGLDFHFDAEIKEQGGSFVNAIRSSGFEFHYWVVDDIDGVHRAFANGAQTLTTNRAKLFLEDMP